ncbi:MAG TPA: maleylpyruvate isomerase N-terminal domain-containing protein [Gemmatimonadales bacterium]|nr:maleylpyruvate isomerase N-terminal domain-containing protein [Gemmatimonadales bacterium]
MPVSPELAASNRTQTERLRRLVQRVTPAQLATRLPNGWTVAVALGHLAFWDRQRYCLLRHWAARDYRTGAYDGDVFNDAMQPLLELIPGPDVAAAALRAAEAVDALLLELPDAMIADTLARPEAPQLDRGAHRKHHLDQVENALS